MKSQKRVWELQSFTVCKVVGMALSLKDLRKIARKFGFSHVDECTHEEPTLHSKVVQCCGTDNPVARHTEKLIEERFSTYGKRLAGIGPDDLVRGVTETPEELGVPLWAILWDIATRRSKDVSGLEEKVFGTIHMLEHQLVKEHWGSLIAPSLKENTPANDPADIMLLKKSLLELQQERNRLQRSNDSLRGKLCSMEAEHTAVRPVRPVTNEPHTCRCCEGKKAERFKVALVEAKSKERQLEIEIAGLRREISVLVQELTERSAPLPCREVRPSECECPFNTHLDGKCVALVGGIDSLECHYGQLIESMGGNFRRHNGDCRGGDKPLFECIGNVDLVVCPIEVNSHTAAKLVKRICKARGIPCCFPRSASVTGLKKAVERHYSRADVA